MAGTIVAAGVQRFTPPYGAPICSTAIWVAVMVAPVPCCTTLPAVPVWIDSPVPVNVLPLTVRDARILRYPFRGFLSGGGFSTHVRTLYKQIEAPSQVAHTCAALRIEAFMALKEFQQHFKTMKATVGAR